VLCHPCLEPVDAASEEGNRTEEETRHAERESESRKRNVVTVAEMAAAKTQAH
jgi:hypothetical protein